MIESQTFSILREAEALPAAKRITRDPKLQSLFRLAGQRSGLPASLIEAMAYLESWGDSRAQSSAGPKGVMQISTATAKDMGLRVILATRYRITRDKVQVKAANGKSRTKIVTRRTPYVVTLRDDRLIPERAIPAAAVYLASLQQRFGGLDWAIFAYHCGAGCVTEMQDLTRRARGIPKDQLTVPRMFFSCNPAWNRELYLAIQQQMQRDYSPTYYFRVMRAQQLLALYRNAPEDFEELYGQYRSGFVSNVRAQHRLSVWLKQTDLVYHSCDDIRSDIGKRLVRAFDRPTYYGYGLSLALDVPDNLEYFSQASPAAVGTLVYIAFETRRLHDAMKPAGEKFQPLRVTALVEPETFAAQTGQHEGVAHCSGQVFDVDYSGLPPVELECLRFVLDDLGWDGYLGFIEDGLDSIHIGCSPTSRDFFATVFQEASERVSTD